MTPSVLSWKHLTSELSVSHIPHVSGPLPRISRPRSCRSRHSRCRHRTPRTQGPESSSASPDLPGLSGLSVVLASVCTEAPRSPGAAGSRDKRPAERPSSWRDQWGETNDLPKYKHRYRCLVPLAVSSLHDVKMLARAITTSGDHLPSSSNNCVCVYFRNIIAKSPTVRSFRLF